MLQYDHVCPWTGTAIGARNLRPFKLFVSGVSLLFYSTIGLLIYFAVHTHTN